MTGIDVGRRLIGQKQFGALASARATATRCCSPTESIDGLWVMRWLRPTRSSKCRARGRSTPGPAKRIARSTFSKAEKPRSRLNVWKDVADVLGAEVVALGFGKEGDVPVVDAYLAAIGPADPGDDVQQGGLAAAAAADQHHLLAGGHVEFGHVEDRQRLAIRLHERFFYVFKLQHDRTEYAASGNLVRRLLRGQLPFSSQQESSRRAKAATSRRTPNLPATGHLPADLALRLGLFHGLPLVVLLLALAEAQEHFGDAPLEVNL